MSAMAIKEATVIGTLIGNNDLIDLLEDLRPEHFHFGLYGTIYDACLAILNAGRDLDIFALAAELQERGCLVDVGGMKGLHDISTQVTSKRNLRLAVDAVKSNHARIAMSAQADGFIQALHSGADPVAECAAHMAELESIQSFGTISTNMQTVGEGLADFIDDLRNRMEGINNKIATGLSKLDYRLTGGFDRGELIVAAARPSMGKTAFALSIALHVAHSKPVVFFSLEMSNKQLAQRAACNLGGVDMAWAQNPNGYGMSRADQDEQIDRLTTASDRVNNMPLYFVDKPAATLADVRSKSKKVKRQHGDLGLIVVDYIGLMGGSKADNRVHAIGEYSRGLKSLAKELDCPIMVLAQLNRKVEDRDDKRPRMADLRDSGEIEQDADNVLLLYRDEVYNQESQDKGIAEVIAAKVRNGEPGTAHMAFIGRHTRFADLAYEYSPPEAVSPKPSKKGFFG